MCFFPIADILFRLKTSTFFLKAGYTGQVRRNAGPFLSPRFIFQVKHLVNSLAPKVQRKQ